MSASELMMQAVVHPKYGEPDVLALEERPRPVPGAEEVLVRVVAACVSIGDHHVITGKPYLIRATPFGGLPGPRNRVPGQCVAGRVEAIGGGVAAFAVGDEVFGQAVAGAFAEFVVIPARQLAPKPANLSFEEAAAVPWGLTALQGLRDVAKVTAGQEVLVNGASGAVGTWAVQIAKALGARVTAVCSARNADRMRAQGADAVIDYAAEDFVAGGRRFDVIFDLVGNRSLAEFRSALAPGGAYLAVSGGGGDWVGPFARMAQVFLTSLFVRDRLALVMTTPNQADFLVLKDLVETGKARPTVERVFPLRQVAEALRQVGAGHSQGQTVLRVAEGS